MIEKVEINAGGRLTNGSFADNHKSRRNTSNNTSDEASEQNKCRCKTAIPFSSVGDEVDSANNSELNDLSSKENSRKRELNRITVTAMVHMQPKPNLRQPEVFNNDAGTLPCEATTTQTETSFKSLDDIEKSGEAVAELE